MTSVTEGATVGRVSEKRRPTMNISMSTVAAPSVGPLPPKPKCAFDFWGIVSAFGPAVPLRDFTSDGARLMVLGATPFCGPWFHA